MACLRLNKLFVRKPNVCPCVSQSKAPGLMNQLHKPFCDSFESMAVVPLCQNGSDGRCLRIGTIVQEVRIEIMMRDVEK